MVVDRQRNSLYRIGKVNLLPSRLHRNYCRRFGEHLLNHCRVVVFLPNKRLEIYGVTTVSTSYSFASFLENENVACKSYNCRITDGVPAEFRAYSPLENPLLHGVSGAVER